MATKKTKKVPAGQGIYTYEDGFQHWVLGMSASERRIEVRKHGKVVKYIPTYETY